MPRLRLRLQVQRKGTEQSSWTGSWAIFAHSSLQACASARVPKTRPQTWQAGFQCTFTVYAAVAGLLTCQSLANSLSPRARQSACRCRDAQTRAQSGINGGFVVLALVTTRTTAGGGMNTEAPFVCVWTRKRHACMQVEGGRCTAHTKTTHQHL